MSYVLLTAVAAVFIIAVKPSWSICPLNCSCPSLDLTNCSDAGLSYISHQDISPSVKILDLSENDIPELDFPPAFPLLIEVNLSRNSLIRAVFPKLSNLVTIDISRNAFTNISDVDISNLPNIQKLNMSRSRRLGHVGVLQSNSLETLDLSFSHVTGFDLSFSENLPNLKTLIVANNSLKSLIHLNSSSLLHLDVSYCEISHLTEAKLSKNLPQLESLYLAHNKNVRLQLHRYSLTEHLRLITVDFCNTGLSEIEIHSLRLLEHGNFAYNSIRKIDDSTFSLNPSLRSLDLSYNNIEDISREAFVNNTFLYTLNISNNNIKQGDWIKHLVNVRLLNISSNQIERIDFSLKNLKKLDLSDNNVASLLINLSEYFPLIEFLNLRSNLIEYIQPLKSDTLKNLNLGYCQISILYVDTFKELKDLSFLDLTGNKLKRLDYKTFQSAPKLTDILLGHNPWSCICTSEQFTNLKTYLLFNTSLTDASSLLCDEFNKTWLETCSPVISKLKSATNMEAIFAVGGIFLVALVGLGAIIYYKSRHVNIVNIQEQERLATLQTLQQPTVHPEMTRAYSLNEVSGRPSVTSDVSDLRTSLPPPSYDEALLLPPLSETERMTRSMDVLRSA